MRQKCGGFTLSETIIATAIIGFIWTTMNLTLYTARQSWSINGARMDLNQSGRININNFLREIRQAGSATVSADKRTVRFNIPLDANNDGLIDLVTGTSTVAYGADDTQDNNGNGIFWEPGWVIEYQIDATNKQLIRQVLDASGNQIRQQTIASKISPDSTLTFFQTTDTPGGTGATAEAIIVSLTTEISALQGKTLTVPLRSTFKARVNFRN